MTYDLAIIGGGPAGCATAIAAVRSGANVLLLERGRYPRHRVCGEFVSAESLALLENLLSDSHRQVVNSTPRIARARIFTDNSELSFEINPPAASISRFDLDLALWNSCAHAGVDAREGCAVTSVEGEGPFDVSTTTGVFQARAVVNAAGRWSFLTSPATRNRAAGQRWIGVKRHFREPRPSPTVDLYFFHGGYCGVQPVSATELDGAGIVNASALVRADVATDLDDVLRCHPALHERSWSWRPATEQVATSPLVFHKPEPVQEKMLQVGDAATFVDPFIGDGVSMALRSGELAARCLWDFLQGGCSLEGATDAYAKIYMGNLAPVFRASSVLRRLLQFPSAIRRPAMSLLQRTPAITRQIVRMTR